MLNPKCDTCMNSRPIISENGIHHSCILSDVKALRCMVNGECYIPVVSANDLAKNKAFKEDIRKAINDYEKP